jgi:N6-adenosine-specific RNA methylase IME4
MSKKFGVIVADPPWSFSDSLKMSDVKRGAKANYSTMSISDIKQLPVKDFISPSGSILALWVPSSLLQEGLDTMSAWGFHHKQTYIWVKNKKESFKSFLPGLLKDIISTGYLLEKRPGVSNSDKYKLKVWQNYFINSFKELSLDNVLAFGMGRLFRQTHEICLIGTSNNKIYKQLANKSQRSVCFAENLKHSAKPETLQDSLEIMFPKSDKLELFARRVRPDWTCLGNEVCYGEDIRDSLANL